MTEENELDFFGDLDGKVVMITGGSKILPKEPEIICFMGYNYMKESPMVEKHQDEMKVKVTGSLTTKK